MRAAHYDGKAFAESGADSIPLDGATQDMKMRESHVEVHLFRRSGGWRPNILVNYRRELGDRSTQADVRFAGSPDSQFAVQGLPLPVNTFSGLFGLAMRTGSGLEYTLDYRTQQAKGESHHSVSFRMRFRLVSRVRDSVTNSPGPAPGSQGAMTEHIGNMRGKSNAARRDARPGLCRRISDSGH